MGKSASEETRHCHFTKSTFYPHTVSSRVQGGRRGQAGKILNIVMMESFATSSSFLQQAALQDRDLACSVPVCRNCRAQLLQGEQHTRKTEDTTPPAIICFVPLFLERAA